MKSNLTILKKDFEELNKNLKAIAIKNKSCRLK